MTTGPYVRGTSDGLSHEGYEQWHLLHFSPFLCSGRVTEGGDSPRVRAVRGDSGQR